MRLFRAQSRRCNRLHLSWIPILSILPACQSLDSIREARQREALAKRQGSAPAITLSNQPRVDPLAKADSFRRQGLDDAALAEFERLISVNPRLTLAYMGAGDIYREKGDYSSAEQRYGKAAELEPQNFGAQYLHGLMLQLLDRLNEAVRSYLRALTIRPNDFNANLNLATAYLQLKEPQEGVPYAEKAVRLDGSSAPARVNLGAIYSALGRHEDAVTEYQQAAELTELSAPLLMNLSESLGRAGRYEEMVNTLQQLIKTEPTAAAYERLGSGLFRSAKYAESLSAYRKALEIDPNYYPALNGVGVCLLNQWVWSNHEDNKSHKEAIAALRRSIQIEKNQPMVVQMLSNYQ